jgi:hypothetical protein
MMESAYGGGLRSRATRILRAVLAIMSGLFVLLGCAAFALSFHTRAGEKRDDAFAAVALFSGFGAGLALAALLSGALGLALRWWRPAWMLPAGGLAAACVIRIAVATYAY